MTNDAKNLRARAITQALVLETRLRGDVRPISRAATEAPLLAALAAAAVVVLALSVFV